MTAPDLRKEAFERMLSRISREEPSEQAVGRATVRIRTNEQFITVLDELCDLHNQQTQALEALGIQEKILGKSSFCEKCKADLQSHDIQAKFISRAQAAYSYQERHFPYYAIEEEAHNRYEKVRREIQNAMEGEYDRKAVAEIVVGDSKRKVEKHLVADTDSKRKLE
jgi:hypothetical protein